MSIDRKPLAGSPLNIRDPLVDRLVSCVVLNDTLKAYDSVTGVMGSVSGGVGFYNPMGDGSKYFDGTGSIAFGGGGLDTRYNATSHPFTVETYVNPASHAGSPRIVCQQSSGTTVWYLDIEPGPILRFYVNFTGGTNIDAKAETTANVPAIGVWSHVVAWLDTSKVPHIAVNGREVTYSSQITGDSAVAGASSVPYCIGSRNGVNFFTGGIGYARLWSRELKESERLSLYTDPYRMFRIPADNSLLVEAPATGSVNVLAVTGSATGNTTLPTVSITSTQGYSLSFDGTIDAIAMSNTVRTDILARSNKYKDLGTITSAVCDGGSNTPNWIPNTTTSEPTGTSIEWASRGSNTIFLATDVSPSWGSWTPTLTVPENRYVQWEARFNTTSKLTPTLQSVNLQGVGVAPQAQGKPYIWYPPARKWPDTLRLPEWRVEICNAAGVKVAELTDIESAEFNWNRKGGCTDFTITLSENSRGLEHMNSDYWLIFYVKDPADGTWGKWFSGYLLHGSLYSKKPQALTFKGIGFVGEMERKQLPALGVGRKSSGDTYIAIGFFGTQLYNKWLGADRSNVASFVSYWSPSVKADEMHFDNANLVEIMNTATEGINPIYAYGLGGSWGVDEERILFMQPVPTDTLHVFDHDDPRIEDLALEWDTTDKANTVIVQGGEANFGNYLRNPSFAETEKTSSGSTDTFDHLVGWVRNPSTGGDVTYFDTYTETSTPESPIKFLHDNNVVYFSGAATTNYLESKPVKVIGSGSGTYSYYFSTGLWAAGRFITGNGLGAKLKVQLYHSTTETGTFSALTASHSLEWVAGEHMLTKKVIFEDLYTGSGSQELWWKVRITCDRASYHFYVDGITMTTGYEKTHRGSPDDAMSYLMSTQYQAAFTNGTPTDKETRWETITNQTIKTYADAKQFADSYFAWHDREIIGGSLTLRSYPHRIAPWQGGITITNVPRPDGTRITVSFPVESSKLSITKENWIHTLEIGDPIPTHWDYIAKAWANTSAQMNIIHQII
jgi:hypothetical protein